MQENQTDWKFCTSSLFCLMVPDFCPKPGLKRPFTCPKLADRHQLSSRNGGV